MFSKHLFRYILLHFSFLAKTLNLLSRLINLTDLARQGIRYLLLLKSWRYLEFCMKHFYFSSFTNWIGRYFAFLDLQCLVYSFCHLNLLSQKVQEEEVGKSAPGWVVQAGGEEFSWGRQIPFLEEERRICKIVFSCSFRLFLIAATKLHPLISLWLVKLF